MRWMTGIGIALTIWCAVIIAGIIRGQNEFDYRKPLLMLAMFATFGLTWVILLRFRSKDV